MDEYADYLYWDQGRNAVRRVRAPVASRPPVFAPAPTSGPVVAAPVVAPVNYGQPAQTFNPGVPVYASPSYGQNWGPMFPQYPQYPQPGAVLQNLISRLTLGNVVDIGARVVASLKDLPAAPTPTGNVETDVANMITYQKVLADHAKYIERVLTVGHVGGLLGS